MTDELETTAEAPPRRSWQAWLHLIRIPNLFSVPGDPLAGLALVGILDGALPPWSRFAVAAGVALCLYIYGLILNDICDLRTDRVERPERPLPARQISIRSAALAGGAFLAAGLGLALFGGGTALLCNALLLAAVVTAYDAVLKRQVVSGNLAMGACRGLSFLLAVEPQRWFSPIGLVALLATGYFAAVTGVARHENESVQHGGLAWAPAVLLLAIGGSGTLLPRVPQGSAFPVMAGALLFTSLYAAIYVGWRLTRTRVSPNLTRQAIGLFIRNWTGVQAAVLVFGGATAWLGALLLLGRPVAGWLGKRFAAS